MGIELVDPPPVLRQRLARTLGTLNARKGHSVRAKALEPWLVQERRFVPRLELQRERPARWHLVVSVDGVPCFSGRYASVRGAEAAWERFKRMQAKSMGGGRLA